MLSRVKPFLSINRRSFPVCLWKHSIPSPSRTMHPPDNKDPTIVHPPHYLHELPQEDEERLEKLFNTLDTDGNGRIDIHDLSIALKDFGVHSLYAQVSE